MKMKSNIPILGIRCRNCGAAYVLVALSHGVEEDVSNRIISAIQEHDEIFITYKRGMIGQRCRCKDTEL